MTASNYEAVRGAIQRATEPGRQAAAFARLSQTIPFTDEQAWALARGGYDVVFAPATPVIVLVAGTA